MTTQKCVKRTAGGKGNLGKFKDHYPRICAAGLPTKQPEITIEDGLQQFLLIDEVNALISDAISPPAPPRPLAPVYYPIKRDQRYAFSATSELANAANPPQRTKFQTLVNDCKETVYASYWNSRLGTGRDPTSKFPEGYDINGTTYGKKNPVEPSMSEIMFPTKPLTGLYNPSKEAGVQTCRSYKGPPFKKDIIFGRSSKVDHRGKSVQIAISDNNVLNGTDNIVSINPIQADFKEAYQPMLGQSNSPLNNISQVPEGHRFGKPSELTPGKECFTSCDLNPGRDFFLECLAHLNSVRKNLSKMFLPSFFNQFYNKLKYMDKEKTGWLLAKDVYEFALTYHIRLSARFVEPLLGTWHAFDGKRIEYKIFCHILNFKARLPDLPKIEEVSPECLDYRTTYSEMTKPDQDPGQHLMAGIPSGRYFDRDYPVAVERQCGAHKILLPMESDIGSCLRPSIMTLFHVSHRDMYAKREPDVVRRVFESAGEKFSEERFRKIWEEAKKYHSQGVVSYETFRKALQKFSELENLQIEVPYDI